MLMVPFVTFMNSEAYPHKCFLLFLIVQNFGLHGLLPFYRVQSVLQNLWIEYEGQDQDFCVFDYILNV